MVTALVFSWLLAVSLDAAREMLLITVSSHPEVNLQEKRRPTLTMILWKRT
jgi:hypothetical protein